MEGQIVGNRHHQHGSLEGVGNNISQKICVGKGAPDFAMYIFGESSGSFEGRIGGDQSTPKITNSLSNWISIVSNCSLVVMIARISILWTSSCLKLDTTKCHRTPLHRTSTES